MSDHMERPSSQPAEAFNAMRVRAERAEQHLREMATAWNGSPQEQRAEQERVAAVPSYMRMAEMQMQPGAPLGLPTVRTILDRALAEMQDQQ